MKTKQKKTKKRANILRAMDAFLGSTLSFALFRQFESFELDYDSCLYSSDFEEVRQATTGAQLPLYGNKSSYWNKTQKPSDIELMD